MKAAHPFTLLLIAACAVSTCFAADSVYRCGNSYSKEPCPDAKVVDAADTRTKAQQAQSKADVQREAKTAKSLERERLVREAKEREAEKKRVAAAKAAAAKEAKAAKRNEVAPRPPKVVKSPKPSTTASTPKP